MKTWLLVLFRTLDQYIMNKKYPHCKCDGGLTLLGQSGLS